MMRKLRTFVAALLLVSALTSNASAFTADGDVMVNPVRSGWCYMNIGGQWYVVPC